MKKNAIKNALRVLVAAICTTIATMSFTSCSEMEALTPELPEAKTEYVEIPVEVESQYATWKTPTHLYVGTSSYQSWVLSAGNLQFAQPIIEVAAKQQGSVSFGQPILSLVSSDNDTDTYTYKVFGTDGQVASDTIKVKKGIDCEITKPTVKLTVNTRSAKFGIAQATEVIVTKTVEFDLTLADGRSEHLVHNTSKSYVQSEVPVKVQVETHVDSVFVTVRDTITNEIHVVDTLYQTIKEIEYVYVEVHDTTVVEREVEKWMHDSIPVIVHDTVTVVKTDTITNTVIEVKTDSVFVTVVEEHEVIVRDTVYLEKYIYLAGERINQKSKVGYATAEVKVGNESILNANLTLAQRFINVELENLCKVEGSGNFSGCTLSDGQVGTLTYSTNGCTVDDVKWDLVVNQLSDIDCEIEVVCTLYCSRTNERGEVIEFEVVLEPAYYHLSTLPEPEPQVVTYSVGFSNSTPANSKLQGTFFVDGTDGFHDEYTMPVAVYGLPQGIETLYVRDMTQFGHTAKSDPVVAGTLKAKGDWNWAYDVVYTTVETQFKTVNDGLVGPYNRLTYKVAHVERTLPNGETVVWTLKATTVVDADEYVQDPACSDHFCEEEQHEAHYEQTLKQHVTHYISGSVKIGNGEEMEVIFTDLQKVGDKYLLDEGTAVTNIYSTGGN